MVIIFQILILSPIQISVVASYTQIFVSLNFMGLNLRATLSVTPSAITPTTRTGSGLLSMLLSEDALLESRVIELQVMWHAISQGAVS